MNPSSHRVAVAFFLKQAVPRALSEALQELDALDELSQSIEEVTDAFSMHYRMAAVPISTEVQSQLDALHKARKGLAKAQEITSRIAALLEIYPEDKTAQRAVKDAAVMVKRFSKHEKDAAKMIRTLSKKAMPEDLKKMAASVQRSIRRKLVDPKALQVLPWTIEKRSYKTNQTGAAFQVVFRIVDESLHGNKAETILEVNTVTPRGVELASRGSAKATSAKEAVAHFLAQLQGYAGLAGEADRTTTRMDAAQGIASALKSWGRKVSIEHSRDADIGKGALTVSFSIRRDTRWESYSDWEYDDGVSTEEKELLASLRPYLKPYQQDIKSLDVNYSEKGGWTAWVQLK